ncbi:MAG TPA: hypothetical protein VLT82_01815 [Myxococcaceae bacterium]|nr:hypothetical protein [Myxococcaceae bacterium]
MALLLGAMVGLVLWRALPFLGPVPPGGLYNSDSAIPVLMSNLATGAPVDWLFWGQDRFGSWPFLAARLAGALADFAWTPHGMHVVRTLWMVAAVLPWVALAGRAWAVAAAGLLLLPGLNPLLGRVLVDLGTVDGWQIPALLWAWWALRRAVSTARPGGWWALAGVAGGLATWTSLVSAPLLVVLALVEGSGRALTVGRRAVLLLPAVVGLVVEGVVRASWHRAVRARGWPDVRTPASLDLGHLLENAGRVASTAWGVGAVSWLLVALVAATVALAVGRWRAAPEGRTVAGAGASALTALLVVIAVRHVRDNGYNPRYLCLGLSLAVLGTSELLGLVLQALVSRLAPGAAPASVGGVGLAAVLLLAPVAEPDPREVLLRPAAAEIAAHHRGAVLALSYWRTYALAALLPPRTVVPVPREGEWNRRPDWAAALRSGRPVLVGSPEVPGEAPAARQVERGATLTLVQPGVLTIPPFPGESTGERLSLYRLAADE